MGVSNSTKENELSLGHNPVPLETANKLSKSICKITYYTTNKINGTGFFMKYNSLKYLISVNHVINSNLINKNIELEIYNKKKINLKLNNRYIKLFEEPIDISVIEIKDLDEINKEDIEYLNYDLNYKIDGYLEYKGKDVLCLGYPFGDKLSTGSGKIINIIENEFEHNISTEQGSSGSPIILFNLLRVIGVHKYADLDKKINVGIFIGEILNEINNDLEGKKNKNDKIVDIKENKKNINDRKNNIIDEKYKLDLSEKYLGNEGIQKLINYKDIIELNLSWNNISDIKVLEKVKFNKLEILNLGENKISNINILENVNFKELKELDLYNNYI